MNGALTVDLPVGTLAALLTGLEYLLSTISALAARAAVHGVWLLGLHRGGEAPLDAQTRTKRSLWKDVLGFLLGILLVTGVALVESSLSPGIMLDDYAINTTACVSVFGVFRLARLKAHKPPFRVTVEPWVIRTAEKLGCTHGLATVGVGGTTDIFGDKHNMSAPTCVNASVDVEGGEVHAAISELKATARFLIQRVGKSPGYTIFPHRASGAGRDIRQLGTAREGKGPCGEAGISGLFTASEAEYESTAVHSQNVTFLVHERICSLHGSNSVNTVESPLLRDCVFRKAQTLRSACARSLARPDQVYFVDMPKVAALFVPNETSKASYACVSCTVRLEYIFLASSLVGDIMPTMAPTGSGVVKPTLPVLIPTMARVISGTCERTIAPVGQAALFYSADAEWQQERLAAIDRTIRYHAYMIAVSSSLFPLDSLPKPERSSTANGSCFVRPVREVTEIPKDWRLTLLFVGLSLAVVTVVVACGFRLFFTGESWSVGSAQWSLTRLLEGGRDGRSSRATLVEVVEIPPESNQPAPPKASRVIPGLGQRILSPREASDGEERPLRLERQYEYRMRTIDRDSHPTLVRRKSSNVNPR